MTPSMTDSLPAAKKGRPWLRRLTIAQLWVFIPVLGVVFAAPLVDTKAPQWVQCTVVPASGETVIGGGLRGSSGSMSAVVIETSDCHKITIKRGVSADNMEALASTFRKGSVFGFKLGWLSRQSAAASWPFYGVSAKNYRRVVSAGAPSRTNPR